MFLRDLLVIVLIAVLVSFLIKTFVMRAFYIPSTSMENTLLVDDRILVDELTPNWSSYSRGEIVVFKDPGGWLPPASTRADRSAFVEGIERFLTFLGLSAADSEDHLVKRIIGLPGDHVVCCNDFGQLTINGVAIDESAYLKLPAGITAASNEPFNVVVPAKSLWVLGDNRTRSQDSRSHQAGPSGGFVPIANVVGRSFVTIWPLHRFGGTDSHGEVFAEVPDPQ
jgi:signal peptidase I